MMDTSSSSGFDEELYATLEELCKVFNLDPETSKDAWEKFEDISRKFALEGNKISWLACSLLATCRRQETTVGDKIIIKSNPISVTLLLRHTNLSLKQFFQCMKGWAVMSALPEEFVIEVQTAEQNFFVCQKVYSDYLILFKKLFNMPDIEAIRTKKKSFQNSPIGVMEFTWLLFLLLKGKYLNRGVDTVECLKILQCCCNLAFKNVIMQNQREILNSDFVGLPDGWNLPDFQIPEEAPCVIDKLLHNFGALNLAGVKYVQDYEIAPILNQLKEEGLQTTKEDYSDLIKSEYFEENYTLLLKNYEQFILQEWCYDENIFLKETYRQIEHQGMKCSNGDMIAQTPVNERRLPMPVPETPLTGRQYVGPADRSQDNSPDSQAQFFAMLAHRPSGMSKDIAQMIADCGGESLSEKIVNIEKDLGAKFLAGIGSDEEKKAIGVKLFYYLMEMVLAGERLLDKDIAPLLKNDFFTMCVFTCAIEIVIYATNMAEERKELKFPWVLKCMQLPAVHLVRIIELVVRNTSQFSRNIIKHLSYVEETILESLMWQEDSVLWKDMKTSNYVIPKFEEIARPGTTIGASGVPSTMRRAMVGAGLAGSIQSEPFQSPRYSNIRPGQSLLNSNRNQLANQNSSNGNTPKKNGSLGIIFRKFYVLAGVRMDDLCKRLNISETETRMKIWTFLEATIRESQNDSADGPVWLLKHRHLDQLILCAVYIVFKRSDRTLNFVDIIKAYKLQPQAQSDVYRQVYFDKENRGDLIEFYNKIYIVHVRSLVTRILPRNTRTNAENFELSPLPANPHGVVSPYRQVAHNFYVNMLESPTNADFNPSYSYYFNQSHSGHLQNINKVIGRSAKRLLTDNNSTEEQDQKKRHCNRKIQALIEEREVQNII